MTLLRADDVGVHRTTLLRADDVGVHRTGTTDVRPDEVDAVVAHLVAAVDGLVRDGGLLASTVLLSRPPPQAPAGTAVRLVHLTRWVSPARLDAAAAALRPGPERSLVGHVDHDLVVHDVVTAGGDGQVRLSADGPATFLLSMDSAVEHHAFLRTFNTDDTRRVFAPLPGFVACAIFGDRRRRRVFEIAQWERLEDFLAATALPAFAEHEAVLDERCDSTDARVYQVVHVDSQS